MGLSSILNALPLPQTVLLNFLTRSGVSAAEYSWDVQISCLTHMDPNFYRLTLTDICYVMLLQEAIQIFEDFITRIQFLQKPLTKEQIEVTRNSIFKVADALEVFALNYGKHQMIGANSSVEINSHKLGESEHDHLFGFITFLLIDTTTNDIMAALMIKFYGTSDIV